MSQSTAKGERITAVLSTLVAIVILAVGVTAQQSQTMPKDELAQLESDLRFQLATAFRHDANQQAERLAQLEEAIGAWRNSSRTEEDRRRLALWLQEATIRSMPGSRESWPEIPEFGRAKIEGSAESGVQEISQQVVEPAEASAQEQTQAELADEIASTAFEKKASVSKQTAEASALLLTAISSSRSHQSTGMDSTAINAVVEQPRIVPAEEPVAINLTELAARIAGYHEGLDRVEIALLSANSPDLDFLAEQLRQLDEMTRDFRFVKLYYKALTDEQRQSVPAPRSMAATLAEVERLLQRSKSASGNDFLGPFDTAYRERIEALHRQLATIASRVN